MNAPLTKQESSALTPLGMSEQEILAVLTNSLYSGAKVESVRLVMAYCQAAKLDVMQKPVHIVPMPVPIGYGKTEYRDVIMPGIGLYRTQAARSGEYGGISEPEYGPSVTRTWGEGENAITVTYPEWCKVTVRRIIGNKVAEFSAKEFWTENFAATRYGTPNSMWRKRPYAQLAKCAESQALRKGFPEVGAHPTFEEMEGRDYEIIDSPATTEIVYGKPHVEMPQPKSKEKQAEPEVEVKPEPAPKKGKTAKAASPDSSKPATEGEKNYIRKKVDQFGLTLSEFTEENGIKDFNALTQSGFAVLKERLLTLNV